MVKLRLIWNDNTIGEIGFRFVSDKVLFLTTIYTNFGFDNPNIIHRTRNNIHIFSTYAKPSYYSELSYYRKSADNS